MKVALLTYHNGVDITFMSREGLDAVRAPDVPQLKIITHLKGLFSRIKDIYVCVHK